MTSQQGSAGGRGSGGPPKTGRQGAGGGSGPATGPSGTRPSMERSGAQQAATGGITGSGPSPISTERVSGPQSTQTAKTFGTGGPDLVTESTSGPPASKKGCSCCGGAILSVVGVTIALWVYVSM